METNNETAKKTIHRTFFPLEYPPFEKWVNDFGFGRAFTKPQKLPIQNASEEDVKRKIILEAQNRFNNK